MSNQILPGAGSNREFDINKGITTLLQISPTQLPIGDTIYMNKYMYIHFFTFKMSVACREHHFINNEKTMLL